MKTYKLRVMLVAVMLLGWLLMPVAEAATTAPDTPAALPNGVRQDWWTQVQQNIQASEYQITWQDQTALADLPAAYQAPNRAQNFRTYFTADDIRVIPRATAHEAPAWEWSLHLTNYGVVDQLQPVAAATLATNGNRVEYQRGDLTEWYVNDAHGLEQGFTLTSPLTPLLQGEGNKIPPSLVGKGPGVRLTSPSLAGKGARGLGSFLILELAVRGNLIPTITEDGTVIDFLTADGAQAIRYDTLVVRGAAGRALPAQFDLCDSSVNQQPGIRILVDVTDAHYPITIDPWQPPRIGRRRAIRRVPSSAIQWGQPGMSTATATTTSSSGRWDTTTARPMKAGRMCITGRPAGWARPRPGPWRAIRGGPSSVIRWRQPGM